ncbi:hypothetical protein PROFUN_05783 [Planoprotostelium fungivorum]|uniref:WRKY domain-containing protein n=1 Tax=Planoprotostelium fungivorum TaxID=1890364 RepID=A0A2P6NPY4_9EUKA|nr:hypothetical protein PROFUN_05783 [Planoprotostelium fungivorum]
MFNRGGSPFGPGPPYSKGDGSSSDGDQGHITRTIVVNPTTTQPNGATNQQKNHLLVWQPQITQGIVTAPGSSSNRLQQLLLERDNLLRELDTLSDRWSYINNRLPEIQKQMLSDMEQVSGEIRSVTQAKQPREPITPKDKNNSSQENMNSPEKSKLRSSSMDDASPMVHLLAQCDKLTNVDRKEELRGGDMMSYTVPASSNPSQPGSPPLSNVQIVHIRKRHTPVKPQPLLAEEFIQMEDVNQWNWQSNGKKKKPDGTYHHYYKCSMNKAIGCAASYNKSSVGNVVVITNGKHNHMPPDKVKPNVPRDARSKVERNSTSPEDNGDAQRQESGASDTQQESMEAPVQEGSDSQLQDSSPEV